MKKNLQNAVMTCAQWLAVVTLATGCKSVKTFYLEKTSEFRNYRQPPLHIQNIQPPTNNLTTLSIVSTSGVTAHLQIMADPDAAEEFGRVFSQNFYVGEVVVENTNTDPFLAYSSSLQVEVSYYVPQAEWRRVGQMLQSKYGGEFIKDVRRPSIYSDILAIFSYEQQAAPRQQGVNLLQSAGVLAGGAAVFVGGPTYPKAVAFATGVVVPEIQKRLLWDLLMHAKNLEARSMKEIEEVPGAGSIHRVVFFPKRGIPGVLDQHLVYISSFAPRLTVGIAGTHITKQGAVASAIVTSRPGQ